MKEGRDEGRKECVHVLFFWGAATVCVCVCGALSRCVFFFFFSSRRCGMAFAGWLVSRLAPSAWFTRSCTRVNVCVCVPHMRRCHWHVVVERDDSIAVRRPFKKGAVCCLLLSSLQQRVVGGGVCVCVCTTYINACVHACVGPPQ
jgi:hypothetical protein